MPRFNFYKDSHTGNIYARRVILGTFEKTVTESEIRVYSSGDWINSVKTIKRRVEFITKLEMLAYLRKRYDFKYPDEKIGSQEFVIKN